MKRGKLIGMGGLILFGTLAYASISMAFNNPGSAPILIMMGIGMYSMGVGVFAYSMTKEGSIYLARRIGSQNIGIGAIVEKGKFLNFIEINYGDKTFQDGEDTHKMEEEKTYFRKGLNIPYSFFRHDKMEALALYDEHKGVEPQVVTALYMSRLAVFKAIAADEARRNMMIAFFIIGGLIILAAGVLYFQTSKGIEATNAVQAMIAALPHPTPLTAPGGIPNV